MTLLRQHIEDQADFYRERSRLTDAQITWVQWKFKTDDFATVTRKTRRYLKGEVATAHGDLIVSDN
jgi:phage terminase Nu1 subunit (DNA packaging protein)